MAMIPDSSGGVLAQEQYRNIQSLIRFEVDSTLQATYGKELAELKALSLKLQAPRRSLQNPLPNHAPKVFQNGT